MQFMVFLPLVILYFVVCIQGDHTVTKRALLFPTSTVLQFTYGLSVPVMLPNRSITLSACVQANYDLPKTLSALRTQTIQARSLPEYTFDYSRETFYKYLIAFLNNFGYEGEPCLHQAICEVAETPMHLEKDTNLLEKIIHFLFTPSLDLGSKFESNFTRGIVLAEHRGRLQDCGKYYKCDISIIDLFTSKYII